MDSKNQNKVLIYTRTPKGDYTESLANSVHFAYYDSDGNMIPLNRNYGILFALAEIDGNNVIQEKGLKDPYIFRTNDGFFGITATRTVKTGSYDESCEGYKLFWTSEDLIHFNYHGFVKDDASHSREEHSRTGTDDIIEGNTILVEDSVFAKFVEYWTPVTNTEIRVPESITARSEEDIKAIRATAVYSDGSLAQKQVEWDLSGVNFSKPGTYTAHGRAVQETLPFPLARGYADPVILPWNGKYYYLATNDNTHDIGMYVREGSTKADLFAPGFKEALILDVDEENGFIQTFWAPEFHSIGDDLYILFAVGGKKWAPQCHAMKLKKGGDIMDPQGWEVPVRTRRSNGAYLTDDGITLDMTYFKVDGSSFVVWSYRKHIGTPLDTGSMLYIASVDENNPTVLTSEPVLLSRPLYGWENIQGTINNEGPYPLITADTVYIAYSGGAAGGYTYAVGLLSIPRGSDYLDAGNWTKSSAPVLSYYSIDGVYGTGHNSFFRDYDGNTYIMYHVEEKIVKDGTRCSAIHRVHFNKDNRPLLNMGDKRDLNEKIANVKMRVIVEGC